MIIGNTRVHNQSISKEYIYEVYTSIENEAKIALERCSFHEHQ